MHLFLTSVLPFLGHDHASAAAFLTCRCRNFHSSIIPEFLSDEDRVGEFCDARQRNKMSAQENTQYEMLFNLFVQTPHMQFSPSLVLHDECSPESIITPLLATKYFTRSLQRCRFCWEAPDNKILHALSKVQSLTKLDLRSCNVQNTHLETIINSFPSLEMLIIENARHLKILPSSEPSLAITSPPPSATKTLRILKVESIDPSVVAQFVCHFSHLRKLELDGWTSSHPLDLVPLCSSAPRLKDVSLKNFTLENTESLKNLVHLSSLEFDDCRMPDSLAFLTQENSLAELRTLTIHNRSNLSTPSFACLSQAPKLQSLTIAEINFNNDCLQFLDKMVHLRKLDLSMCEIVGDSRSLKDLMRNLVQLEELSLAGCRIGNQGALTGALYSSLSRLRVLNLSWCHLVDDDLEGIGALKKTIEELYLDDNGWLTNKALIHFKTLVKLKCLILRRCGRITDLSPLAKCSVSLETLDVSDCSNLTDDSFRVFSAEPDSFPSLRVLRLSGCNNLTENVFGHLSKNNHLVCRLKKLCVMSSVVASSPYAQTNICQLQGLRVLSGIRSSALQRDLRDYFLMNLKNVEHVEHAI